MHQGAKSHFQRVNELYHSLLYMNESQALIMRDFIKEHGIFEILEIGFFKGKSSAYFAAILEDLDRGHLTTIDKRSARRFEPNILDVLKSLNLTRRVTPIFSDRSYTWELGKLIRQSPRPQFDMCYFDGGHTWDSTGFGFVLVDMLLKPGGWIVFDDMDWTISGSLKQRNSPERLKAYEKFSEDEKNAPAVRLVFDYLAPHFQYEEMYENKAVRWGFARKPAASP